MVVGAAVVELRIRGAHSLKQKRGVVRQVVQRVRNRFNLSVAEVGGQDTWQLAILGFSAAGADADPVRRVLRQAIDFVEATHLAELRDSDIEIITLPLSEREGFPSWDLQE
ncbi:MAG: DUF503 domain-containing protein [Myxococcota bacterium]|jgi:hypothetical protein